MKRNPIEPLGRQLEREVERERHERELHDELRSGTAPLDDLRTKDAREHTGAAGVRRPAGH
jgi:hypothetical protein